jgi:UDP-N-acetylglucosamine acyltransferase
LQKNIIHPTAVVAIDVELGENNRIGPYSIIGGMGCKVSIGSNNYFGAYALIGSPAEFATGCPVEAMLDFDRWTVANPSQVSGVKIGNSNVLRDRVSIDAGIYQNTTITDRCYLHSNCLVNHDCQLSEGVVLAPGVISAGTCSFGKYSQIGVNAVLHQGRKVGAFAMVGMNATVTRDIPDFAMSFGSPSRTIGVNRVRLSRLGISNNDIDLTNDFLLGLHQTCPETVLDLLT